MKKYVRASITSEVNDIVNNEKDIQVHENSTTPCRSEGDVLFQVRHDNPENLEITKYEYGDPDYQKYHLGLNPDYKGPYYIGRWNVYSRYNATMTEELNDLLKRVKTYEELTELKHALEDTGWGLWFYTKRGDNPLNGSFDPVPGEPDTVTYIVDRHSAILKCKISNLYKVLKIY